eukprot:CAMPEP_0175015982 /NCGR_PEP_ID=MMETSP0005-20121125/11521_1 /TAXON_ID=420556 /ORGANISM="Ochromonas sp., Strain CCMP1393" /LENGTH=261 /DNA_ID=CAMNT_0016273099 /DNA_START=321 /DNA_END=1102 /DNA_ORIENTATION=+
MGLLAFQAIYILMELFYENESEHSDNCDGRCFHADNSSTAFRIITAMCFVLLGVCQSIFAVKLNTLVKPRYDRYFGSSPFVMTIVNCILIVAFFCRGLYQLMAACRFYILPDVPLLAKKDVPLVVFLLFELWDYIPTILVIATITSRSVGSDAQSRSRNKHISQASSRLLRTSTMLPNNYSSLLYIGDEDEEEDDDDDDEEGGNGDNTANSGAVGRRRGSDTAKNNRRGNDDSSSNRDDESGFFSISSSGLLIDARGQTIR